MTPTDLLISLALIALVLRQVRGRPLTPASLLWPVPLVLYSALSTLHTLPSGPGLEFTVLGGVTGLTLGVLCGLLTRVRPGRTVIARATGLAALLWVLGVGARVAFGVYAVHGGAGTIARFSAAHRLDMAAWASALLLMSLLEVLGRAGTLLWKRARVIGTDRPALSHAV